MQTTFQHLAHRAPAKTMLPHPLEFFREGPGTAQNDLHDVIAAHETQGDTAKEGSAVRKFGHPEHVSPGVGMRVEVNDRVALRAEFLAQRLHDRRRNRMISTQHDQRRNCIDYFARSPVELGVGGREIRGRALDITVIGHIEHAEWVDAELHVRMRRWTTDIFRLADRSRAKSRAGPEGDAFIERSTQDRDIDAGKILRFERQWPAAVGQPGPRSTRPRSLVVDARVTPPSWGRSNQETRSGAQ